MNKLQREKLRMDILHRDGDYICNKCKKGPTALIGSGQSPMLDIDHKDNDNSNNHIDNLQFLCASCNTLKANREDKHRHDKGPIEFQTGKKNMAEARKYVAGLMEQPKGKSREYHTLLDDLAEYLDCSQQAVKGYLSKLTSDQHGQYEWRNEQYGNSYLHRKSDKNIEYSNPNF